MWRIIWISDYWEMRFEIVKKKIIIKIKLISKYRFYPWYSVVHCWKRREVRSFYQFTVADCASFPPHASSKSATFICRVLAFLFLQLLLLLLLILLLLLLLLFLFLLSFLPFGLISIWPRGASGGVCIAKSLGKFLLALSL